MPQTISAAPIGANLVKKLIHQSQKRATSENGILLGGFAKTHVPRMSPQHLQNYSRIISENDLDLFAWLSGNAPVPEGYKNCTVFKQLQDHTNQLEESTTVTRLIK